MENAAGHLDVLLAALGDETDADLSTRGACAAPLATNHELEALRRWNESSARAALVADDAMTLPVVLAMNAATVRGGADADAAQLERERAWGYRRVLARALHLADELERLILGDRLTKRDGERLRGRFVGVYLSRGPDLLAALLAVHLTRAAYVPLDPVYPAERVGGMLKDARVSAVITSDADGLSTRVAEAAEAAGCLRDQFPTLLADDAASLAAFEDAFEVRSSRTGSHTTALAW
jgi:non-ribosomal peptide synthetase component F